MSLIEPQLTSSVRQDWETPQDLLDKLNEIYRFDWDAAATASTFKVGPKEAGNLGWYYGPDHEYEELRDAFAVDWQQDSNDYPSTNKTIWLNPPYGRDIRKWMDKAYEESRKPGLTVVVLTFARTDTRWWHEVVSKAAEVRLLKGRVKFLQDGKVLAPAPAPSAVITFAGWSEGPPVVKFGL